MGENNTTNALFTNIKPPSALPNFVTSSTPVDTTNNNVATTTSSESSAHTAFITPSFSAAIPADKNTSNNDKKSDECIDPKSTKESDDTQKPAEEKSMASVFEPITQGSGSLLGWMKEAIPANLLHKVAETAKSSVDTLVTTLDPQMKEYLYSGGDTEIVVASDKEEKIRPIREAFQEVFGRATVIGKVAQAKNVATQPVGFKAALLACMERVSEIQSTSNEKENTTVVALENCVVEILPNQWFDAGFLFLMDSARNLTAKSVTQMTPIPDYIITNLKEDSPTDYVFKDTGFSVTIGQLMATNLNAHHSEWHKVYTGVPRADMIRNAAKTLASVYKNKIYDQENKPK